jgi:DnaK suppressor protein
LKLQEKIRSGAFHAIPKQPERLIRPAPQLVTKATAKAAPAKKAAPKKAAAKAVAPAVASVTAEASAELEVPAELLNKPFKELTKEERILVSRARSRAMRAKAGVPTATKAGAATDATPVAAALPEVEEVEEAVEVAADPLAEVPAELLNKPFKDLTKDERIIVSRARSRAMRAKSGLPVASKTGGAAAPAPTAPQRAAEPAVEVEEVSASANGAADPLAEVPPELLNKPFKDLTKDERIIVSRARSRAMRAKAGKPVGGGNA